MSASTPATATQNKRSREYGIWKAQAPLAAGFVLLFAIGTGLVWLLVNNHRFNESVSHTLEVRTEAYRLLTLVQDAETGQRGFILTKDSAYLGPFETGRNEVPLAAEKLRTLVQGNEMQVATMSRLQGAIDGKLKELSQTVAMTKNGDIDGAIARVKSNVGKVLMDEVRRQIGNIESEEQTVQDAQAAAVERNGRMLAVAGLVAILFIIGLAAYVINAARRSTASLLKAQDDLRHTNENLEGIVAERVSDLQMANEEIQRFAYIVSHDLRAPLVNVMGFTSELETAREEIAGLLKAAEAEAPALVTPDRKMAVETDLPESLGFIRTSTAKMDRLINAILKLSREGKRVLTPQTIELHDLLEAQGESLSQQLQAGDAELVIQPDLPDIVSDKLAVEQIFGNLIENAVKYLKPGRPGRISVTGRSRGAFVSYDIIDNGRGIEERDFERVFELFRRSGEQDQPGEGIGLAYVRNLARRLGGNVVVKSEFGTGSTFTVTLPAVLSVKARTK